ncbi:unnamed protein product [Sympodiomycopsis kandeliae]
MVEIPVKLVSLAGTPTKSESLLASIKSHVYANGLRGSFKFCQDPGHGSHLQLLVMPPLQGTIILPQSSRHPA